MCFLHTLMLDLPSLMHFAKDTYKLEKSQPHTHGREIFEHFVIKLDLVTQYLDCRQIKVLKKSYNHHTW